MISPELFHKIKKNQKRLLNIDSRLEDIKTMPYYTQFGSEQEREKDLQFHYEALKLHLDERQALLEQLQLEINKDLQLISQNQRILTLKIKQYEEEDQGLLWEAAQQEQQGNVPGAHCPGVRQGPAHHS